MGKQIIGSRVRAAREALGWSQTDLAKRARMRPSAVSHFETGRRQPTVANLMKLASALGRSMDYLTGWSPSKEVRHGS